MVSAFLYAFSTNSLSPYVSRSAPRSSPLEPGAADNAEIQSRRGNKSLNPFIRLRFCSPADADRKEVYVELLEYNLMFIAECEQVMWPRMIANKFLRRKSGGEKFNGEAEAEEQGITVMTSEIPRSSAPQTIGRPQNVSREMPMRGESENKWTQGIDNREYRLFVGTWNVAGRSPPHDLDLEEWLNVATEPADIYVLGFQEIVPLKAGNVFRPEDSGSATKWEALIRKTLNRPLRAERGLILRSSSDPPWNVPLEDGPQCEYDCLKPDGVMTSFSLPNLGPGLAETIRSKCSDRAGYKRVASKQMVGILITIWARSDLRRHIHDLSVSCVGCGIMGCLGNKGSVSVSLSLHGTTCCFVCTHLASGEKKGDEVRRNSDVAEILKRTCFPRFPHTILQHEQIVWFGDLNYRLALPEKEAMPLIHKRDWKSLQHTDQLKTEKLAGRVFEGWREGNLDFAPTYKYAVHSDEYSATQISRAGEKRRVPAWCDRILWYGNGLDQLSYGRSECRFSDHRAVYALFSTHIDLLNDRKPEKALGFSMEFEEADDFLSGQIHNFPIAHHRGISEETINYAEGETMEDLLPLVGRVTDQGTLGMKKGGTMNIRKKGGSGKLFKHPSSLGD